MIKGQVNLQRILRRMPKEIQRVVENGLRDSANLLFRDAQSRVPKNTGKLAEAMHLKRGNRGLSFTVGYWKKGNKRNWKKAGWRAHFIEFGTRTEPARPFMGPAFRANEKEIIHRIDSAVDKALKRASEL